MSHKNVSIKKSLGNLEPFSIKKLKKSLESCEISDVEIESIIAKITPKLYHGISSDEIYNHVLSFLKKRNPTQASKYSLKKAIFDLGPTGYPFEKLISALLKQKGYSTKVGVILQGECVSHEIDVLAEKDGFAYTIECKFHSNPSTVSNVKVPLYINSRFLDVQQKWNSSNKKVHLKQGWLVTNTRFTKDAINYAKCVDLTLLSWDYPKGKGISKNIDTFGLYPITTLYSLSKLEKTKLIKKNIILIKELLETPDILKTLKIPSHRIAEILMEVQKLCRI